MEETRGMDKGHRREAEVLRQRLMTLEEECEKQKEELRRSTALYRSMLGAIPDIVYKLDADGNILFINEAVRKYGYTPEELIGVNLMTLIHPEDREKAVYGVNERRNGDRSTRSLEVRLLTKRRASVSFEINSAGDEVHPTLLISAKGIYTSEMPRPETFWMTQGVARDISERKQAEDALKKEDEQWREMAETLSIPIVVSRKTDGTILYANRQFALTFGEPEEEWVGRPILGLYVNPAERRILLEKLQLEGSIRDYELQLKRADGTPLWVSLTSNYMQFKEETVLLSGFYDITQRKEAEEALREMDRIRVLHETAGAAAHEINQPLTGILGMLDLLMMKEDLDAGLKGDLEMIYAQAERISEILDKMVNTQRYATKPYVLGEEIIDFDLAS